MIMLKIETLKNSTLLLSCVGVLALTGCGETQDRTGRQQQQVLAGTYVARLTPLNTSVAGRATGLMTITITEKEFIVEQNVTGAPAGTRHLQSIHTGGSCPDATADRNGDGVIDAQEGMQAYGRILVPLDSDLNSQIDGADFGPLSSRNGSFTYSRRASLENMIADLRDEDHDPEDAVVKLERNESLNLAGRTVVIYGIPAGRALPPTAASLGALTPHESLPIACGVIMRTGEEDVTDEVEEVSGTDAYRIEDEQGVDYGT
jgi:hypothetical protein